MFKCRLANEMDVEELLSMLFTFHQDSPYRHIEWEYDTASDYLFTVLSDGLIVVAEDDIGDLVGCIGGVYTALPFNNQHVSWIERFYYVYPESRNKSVGTNLLAYLETKLGDSVNSICMGTNRESPEMVHDFLSTHNYVPIETLYLKEI